MRYSNYPYERTIKEVDHLLSLRDLRGGDFMTKEGAVKEIRDFFKLTRPQAERALELALSQENEASSLWISTVKLIVEACCRDLTFLHGNIKRIRLWYLKRLAKIPKKDLELVRG